MATFIYDTPTTALQIPTMQGSIIADPNLPGYVSPLDVDLLQNKPTLPQIDYTNLDFSSIKLQLLNLLKANAKTYGYSLRDFGDSNTAGMLLNMTAYMGQMISYHADAMVNELFLDTSQSSWSTFRLLSLFGYKPTRPQPGIILLAVARTASQATNSSQAALENSSEINFSSSLARKRLSLGTETYEIFPTKILNGNLVPDLLQDFIIPPFVSPDPNTVDIDLVSIEQNLYFCFGLTGTTIIENFTSTGSANQTIQLGQSPVLSSQVIVQVESDSNSKLTGQTIYDVWDELSYLSLAGFRPATRVGTALDNKTPYLISAFKLSPAEYTLKKQNQLIVGTVMELTYDNLLSIAKFSDFNDLLVPYITGILINIQSQKYSDDSYVDILLYHPNYIYGSSAETVATYGAQASLINYVYTGSDKIYWNPGDILYLLNSKLITTNYLSFGAVYQPQIISDSQLQVADTSLYPDIAYLNANPDKKIAIGKALTANSMALGISADYDTYIESDQIYEVTTDGNFNCSVKFGDGTFGKIPFNGANISVRYRVDDSNTTGNVVSAGTAAQTISVGNTNLFINNYYDSAPPIAGETSDTSKLLVSRYFASQDRAVTGTDYTVLVKKYNSDIKVTTALSKADSDSSVIRLYTLVRRVSSALEQLEPLSYIEKLQLSEYLSKYKCLGASTEIVDGLIRPIDLRVDAKIKAGYLAGQVKADLQSVISSYFSLTTTEMGAGFSASDFHNAMSTISGIADYDCYFGGTETATLIDGTIVPLGNRIFMPVKDIPSYNESTNSFPSVGNTIIGVGNLTQPMNAYEILVLNTAIINTASR